MSFIVQVIKEVGDSVLNDFQKNPIPGNFDEFKVQFDWLDKKCLTLFKSKLAAQFPQTPWAEGELDFDQQLSLLAVPEYWICDTVDGAIQFIQHLPGWTVNLVLVREGRPYFSGIYDPLHGEMYWAKEGKGAFMNDLRMKPSLKNDFRMMIAGFSHPPFSADVPGLNHRISVLVERALDRFGAIRNYGPTALQIASVAAGRMDVFIGEGLDTFNWLAGILIAKEAGAEILTVDGHQWTWGSESLLVTGPGVGKMLINALEHTSSR